MRISYLLHNGNCFLQSVRWGEVPLRVRVVMKQHITSRVSATHYGTYYSLPNVNKLSVTKCQLSSTYCELGRVPLRVRVLMQVHITSCVSAIHYGTHYVMRVSNALHVNQAERRCSSAYLRRYTLHNVGMRPIT